METNREIKSSVFADLFGDDELVGKKNFLALYNAIHGTDLKYEERRLNAKQFLKVWSTRSTTMSAWKLMVS